MDLLDTGDIILFKSKKPNIITKLTHSPYSHVGIIVKDPWWDSINPGLYIIQSIQNVGKYMDVEQGKKMSGVQIDNLSDVIKNRSVDAIHIYGFNRDDKFKNNFLKIHLMTINKPYDNNICDWISIALFSLGCKCFKTYKHDDNFWCSALVGYFYVQLGFLPETTDWSNLTPGDISKIMVLEPYKLSKIIHLQFS